MATQKPKAGAKHNAQKTATGRPEKAWSWTYSDLMALTGKELNAIHQAASRGTRGTDSGFTPDNFRSVVLWVFRNASDSLRQDIMGQMGFHRAKKN